MLAEVSDALREFHDRLDALYGRAVGIGKAESS
jgi:hypothetical protein